MKLTFVIVILDLNFIGSYTLRKKIVLHYWYLHRQEKVCLSQKQWTGYYKIIKLITFLYFTTRVTTMFTYLFNFDFSWNKGVKKASCRPIEIHFKLYAAEVESSRTPLAWRTSLRTHFEVHGLGLEGQVFGFGLEASSPQKLPFPRLENSTIF